MRLYFLLHFIYYQFFTAVVFKCLYDNKNFSLLKSMITFFISCIILWMLKSKVQRKYVLCLICHNHFEKIASIKIFTACWKEKFIFIIYTETIENALNSYYIYFFLLKLLVKQWLRLRIFFITLYTQPILYSSTSSII